MNYKNLLRTALRGISANRLRSGLTALGIVIGSASVIAMLALGNGARVAVENNFRFLGSDQIQISKRFSYSNGKTEAMGKILSYEDGLKMLDEVKLLSRVEMQVSGNTRVRRGRTMLDLTFQGITSYGISNLLASGEVQPKNWPEKKALTEKAFLAQGRFFTAPEVLEAAPVCILGSKAAEDLFAGDDPLGENVTINRKTCMVIGVMAELEARNAEQRGNFPMNSYIYLPVSTAIQTLFEKEPSVSLQAFVKDESKIDEAKEQIVQFLRKRHQIEKNSQGKYQDDFDLMTRKEILGAQQEAANTFSLLLAAMAVVSLVVGGIGIMNVMLVSVSERTREIGIRLAVGAQRRDIIGQFLLEAGLLSVAGGLAGVVLGVLSIPLAAGLNQGLARLAPNSIPLALCVSLITGLGFGLYPALRAARLNPIEALRYE